MTTGDFWTRKRQELQQQGVLPSEKRSEPISGPWWADGTSILQNRPRGPENPSQGSLEPSGIVDGHDVSKAAHLKSSSTCPSCGSGDFMKPSSTTATRCFSCGFVEGRQVNDTNLLSGIVNPGAVKTLKVKQTLDGGSHSNRTHMGASVADINYNNSVLEQSAQGKGRVDKAE